MQLFAKNGYSYDKQIKKIRSIFKNFKNIWIFPYLHISERPFLSYTFPPLSIIHHRRTVDKETHKNRIVPLYVRLLWKSFLRLSRRGSPRHRENMKNSRREKERERAKKRLGPWKFVPPRRSSLQLFFPWSVSGGRGVDGKKGRSLENRWKWWPIVQ